MRWTKVETVRTDAVAVTKLVDCVSKSWSYEPVSSKCAYNVTTAFNQRSDRRNDVVFVYIDTDIFWTRVNYEVTKATGDVVTIAKADIKAMNMDANASIMPDDLSEAMTVKDFQDLLSYLVMQKGETEK